MRTIKFRGYCLPLDKWIYGSLIIEGLDSWIAETHQGCFVKMNISTLRFDVIIPDTVGQFTGLFDKNGKEIYEGDIVKYFKHPAKIAFEYGCFIVTNDNNFEGLHELLGSIEVIGNIHENPELLK